jgi:hypothetical protein
VNTTAHAVRGVGRGKRKVKRRREKRAMDEERRWTRASVGWGSSWEESVGCGVGVGLMRDI